MSHKALSGQAHHGGTDVHADVHALVRQVVFEQFLGEPTGTATVLEDRSRLSQTGIRDECRQGRALVEEVLVLLRAEPIVESAGFRNGETSRSTAFARAA